MPMVYLGLGRTSACIQRHQRQRETEEWQDRSRSYKPTQLSGAPDKRITTALGCEGNWWTFFLCFCDQWDTDKKSNFRSYWCSVCMCVCVCIIYRHFPGSPLSSASVPPPHTSSTGPSGPHSPCTKRHTHTVCNYRTARISPILMSNTLAVIHNILDQTTICQLRFVTVKILPGTVRKWERARLLSNNSRSCSRPATGSCLLCFMTACGKGRWCQSSFDESH